MDKMLSQEEFDSRLAALRNKRFSVLSHGGVTLIDAMGSDRRIVEAARTTSDLAGKGDLDDRNLIRYLLRHRHCYDEQTEVLTDRGFMLWRDVVGAVTADVRLGTWDPEAESLCYEKPTQIVFSLYDGEMYQVAHGGVDLLVTPEHRMWVRYGQGAKAMDEFALVPAGEIGDRSMVRYSKLAPWLDGPVFDPAAIGLPADDAMAFLSFAAFFIGDGSVSPTSANCVDFNLKKPRKRVFLKSLCERMGWECRELSGYRMSVHAPQLAHKFRELFFTPEGDKKVPRELQFLGEAASQALLDGFRNSDGTGKRSTWEYGSSVKDVAEAVQLIGLHGGEAAHICHKCDGMYSVMFLARMREPVVNQGRVNTSRVPYRGLVYCATTRTGVLVVRRNGKIVLSGNSTPFEFPQVTLLVECPMDTWRQWIRHRMASVNEFSSRYSEVPDVNDETEPGAWRLQSKANRQGSAGNFVTEWPEGYSPVEVLGTGGLPNVHLVDVKPVGQQTTSDRSTAEKVTPVFVTKPTPGEYLSAKEDMLHAAQRHVYEERLKFGVAKEQARKDLCLSTYTRAFWHADLHNTLHFLGLRMDSHAQLEIRLFANQIGEILKELFPVTWAAFEDYRLHAMQLTALDQQVIRNLQANHYFWLNYPFKPEEVETTPGGRQIVKVQPHGRGAFMAAQHDDWRSLEKCRERDECWQKLLNLGLVADVD